VEKCGDQGKFLSFRSATYFWKSYDSTPYPSIHTTLHSNFTSSHALNRTSTRTPTNERQDNAKEESNMSDFGTCDVCGTPKKPPGERWCAVPLDSSGCEPCWRKFYEEVDRRHQSYYEMDDCCPQYEDSEERNRRSQFLDDTAAALFKARPGWKATELVERAIAMWEDEEEQMEEEEAATERQRLEALGGTTYGGCLVSQEMTRRTAVGLHSCTWNTWNAVGPELDSAWFQPTLEP
jgi:hypothetical protein